MEYKRIIPCLDVLDGRVVKGVNFVIFADAGDPAEIAEYYSANGADEVVFLDISASSEDRGTLVDVVKRTVEKVKIPFTVGGGIRTVEDAEKILNAGATKVSVNSAGVKRPELLNEISKKFGSETLVAAIDAKKISDGNYEVYYNGGKIGSGIDVIEWAIDVEKRGAGEILLTSMDLDGMKTGYDIELTKMVSSAVNIPVIASGGAGKLEDFYDAFEKANAKAALAASLFHFKELEIREVKNYLHNKGIKVRI